MKSNLILILFFILTSCINENYKRDEGSNIVDTLVVVDTLIVVEVDTIKTTVGYSLEQGGKELNLSIETKKQTIDYKLDLNAPVKPQIEDLIKKVFEQK